MNKIKITYASKSEHNFAQRLVIKSIERATGSKKLEKLYKEYSKEINDPRFFWTNILKIMDIKITNKSKVNLEIPPSGPLLLISNHPFGIIDGLILCSLASKVRSDFKIMTHETLKLIPELDRFILPIDFGGKDKKTIKNNIKTPKFFTYSYDLKNKDLIKKINKKLKFPVVVKPLNEGSSVNVYICNQKNIYNLNGQIIRETEPNQLYIIQLKNNTFIKVFINE